MRFAGRLSRAAFTRLVDEQHDKIRRSVGLLPLYGLVAWSGPRMIGQWGWSNDVLSTAGLAHGVRTEAGPWAEIVTTAGLAEEFVTNQRTTMALAAQPARDGETFRRVLDAVAAERPDEVGIEVDGVVRTFRYWREQPIGPDNRLGWYAALDGVPGLVVTASGLEPQEIRLVVVADAEPYLVATREHLLATYDAATPPSDQP